MKHFILRIAIVVLTTTALLGQIRYQDVSFQQVTRTNNITFGQAEGIDNQQIQLRAHFFEPTGDAVQQRPLIIFVHGGGFTSGSLDDQRIIDNCDHFARLGYVTASVQYRIGVESSSAVHYFEANLRASQDVKAAIRFFRANAATYRIDPMRIFLVGQSAGGYTTLAASYLDKQSEYLPGTNIQRWGSPEGNSNQLTTSSSVQAVVNLWGAIFDTQWMEAGNIPVASLHGTADATVPHTSSTLGMYATPAIIQRANAIGIPNSQRLIVGMNHGPANNNQFLWTDIRAFVRDFLFSFTQICTPAPLAPQLTLPTNTDTTVGLLPTFTWQLAENATSYRIQVSLNQNFSSPIVNTTVQNGSYLVTDSLQFATTYHWRVQSIGLNGTSDWSAVRNFRTVRRPNPPPPPPQGDTCSMAIGINLYEHNYYNYEQPFADLMKGGSRFISSNSRWINGGQNKWDTGLIDSVERDNEGYVLKVPFWHAGVEDSQTVKTLMVRDIEGTYQAGDYTCFFDGDGQIDFSLDASVVGREQGIVRFRVTTPTNAGILLTIRRSNPLNHIRNIRVVHSSRLTNYRTNPFNEEFVNKLRKFSVIRTMQWTRTNSNAPSRWANRYRYEYHTQANGVSWEYIFLLANITKKDIWINIPHNADSTYIAELGSLARKSLDENITIRLEYSNEVWNGIFPQFAWVGANAPSNLNDAQKYAFCMQNAFRIFMREWVGAENRVIKVAGGFSANPWTSNQILSYVQPGTVQVISPGGYFNLSSASLQLLTQKGANATVTDVFNGVREWMNESGYSLLKQHDTIAKRYNVKLEFYEAGQHLTTYPFGTRQPYEKAIWDAQKDPQMETVYRDWMKFCRDSIQARLFVAYAFVAKNESQYGSWGALTNLYANPSTQPKFRALTNFSCYTGPQVTFPTDINPPSTMVEPEQQIPMLHPSPIVDIVTIPMSHKGLQVYDLLGRVVIETTEQSFSTSSLPHSSYTVRVQTESGEKLYRFIK